MQGDDLTDLDFADDIVLINERAEHLQQLTDTVANYTKRNQCGKDKMYEY